MKLKNILLLFICLSTVYAYSQKIIIKGTITDASTNEPIMYANVYVKGTAIGTMSDFSGNYTLEITRAADSLVVQSLGYATKTKKIEKTSVQRIDFQLSNSNVVLDEVVIRPSENPAFPILRSIWKTKRARNPEKLKTYRYDSYVKTTIALNNLSEKFKNRKSMRPFMAVFDSLKAKAGEDGKIVLPVLTSETVSDYYYQKFPKLEKEFVKATNSKSLINVSDILQPFLGSSQHKYNFYNNWVIIFDKPFASPISTLGRMYYRYYLMDSLLVDGDTAYLIKFKPKRKRDLAFTGKMWIDKHSLVLRRIKVSVSKKANLNFIEGIKIEQSLIFADSSVVFPIKNRVLVDAANFTPNYGVLAKFTLMYTHLKLNPELPAKTFNRTQEYAYDMNDKTDSYWNKQRDSLFGDSAICDQSYKAIETLKNVKSVKRMSNLIDFALEGYGGTKYFEFGHYMFFLGYNKDEGFRAQIGGRTTYAFSKRWMLKGHLAYGFFDEKFKYALQTEYFVSRKNWAKIGARYQYDVRKVGVDQKFIDDNPLLAFSLALSSQFGGTQYNALGDDYSLWFRTDLGKGFQQKILLQHYDFIPYSSFPFAYYGKHKKIYQSYTVSEISLETKFSRKERFIVRGNDRIGVGSRKGMVYTFKYTLGLKDVLNSTFDYHKFSLNMKRKVEMGSFGRLRFSMTANKVIGKVPPTLLNILQGNESFVASEKGYNKMKFFEFVANQSLELSLLNHFDGFWLNKIPLFRALKWRTIASFDMAWGSYGKRFSETMPEKDGKGRNTIVFKRLDPKTPYVEASVGIENIFKLFRIQLVRRFTYLEPKENPYAVMGAVYLSF